MNAANSTASSRIAADRLDEASLERWMVNHIAGFEGPVTVERFAGGQSNPTFEVRTPAASYVLRRKPSGTLVRGAHAIEREAQVMTALQASGVPAPRVFGLCEDAAVIGAPFYVMEKIEGRIFWDAALPDLEPKDRAAAFDAMNQTIARLHALDISALGLADFGKHDDYLSRQVAMWSRQYRDDPEAGRDPDMDWLLGWLPDNLPPSGGLSLVHGDFKIDNLIFSCAGPTVAAVIDWELATLGDPLADFAYHLMMYRMPPDIVAGLLGADLAELGIPDEVDYLARYAGRRNLDAAPDLRFHLAFNFFRLAAIFHGIAGRVLRGTASSQQAAQRAANYPRLARLARQQIDA